LMSTVFRALPAAVKSRFFTSKSRSLTSPRWPSMLRWGPSARGGTMTAPTTTQIPGFGGDVIAPGHDGYDGARAVWNATVDRRPRLIARCRGTAGVAAAVRFARDRDLEIAVRGGGHNVAGTAVCDGGIVIDLSAMRGVSVDPVERIARVQGGALWGDVDHQTQAHGLPPRAASWATPVSAASAWAAASAGSCASTGSPSTTSSRPRWS